MAKNIPNGFSSGSRIIRNPLPGTKNILPYKRLALTFITPRQEHRPPHAIFSSDTLFHV